MPSSSSPVRSGPSSRGLIRVHPSSCPLPTSSAARRPPPVGKPRCLLARRRSGLRRTHPPLRFRFPRRSWRLQHQFSNLLLLLRRRRPRQRLLPLCANRWVGMQWAGLSNSTRQSWTVSSISWVNWSSRSRWSWKTRRSRQSRARSSFGNCASSGGSPAICRARPCRCAWCQSGVPSRR